MVKDWRIKLQGLYSAGSLLTGIIKLIRCRAYNQPDGL